MDNKKTVNPRHISFIILNTYFAKQSQLKKLIDRKFHSAVLTGRDRAFAFDLIKGTVRFMIIIDYAISCFSDRKPGDIDLSVLTVLRSAVYQFMCMNRVPPHAIVNESVSIAKKQCGISSSSFINAILRKISKIDNLGNYIELRINKSIKDEFQKISLKYSMPLWLVKYFRHMYDKGAVEEIFAALNREATVFARVNRLKTSKDKLVDIFLKQGLGEGRDFDCLAKEILEKELFSDTLVLKNKSFIKSIDGYRQGYFYIQDFSSQLAVKYFLKPQKNEKILDLCGAPGGKAAYMSELAENKCFIVSVDINREKLNIFSENIERLGLENITLVEGDAANPETYSKYGYFDKIFVDAPCSAFGTISKNPDVKYNRDMNQLKKFSGNSLEILQGCLDRLKSSGILVFYTCTLSHIENQDTINEFAAKNSSKCRIAIIDVPSVLKKFISGKKPGRQIENEPFFEILPYYFGSEGGFISVIEKI